MPITVSQMRKNSPPLSPEEEKKQLAEFHQSMKDFVERGPKLSFPIINIAEEKAAIAAIQQSDPTDFQSIAASTLDLCNAHYTSVRIKSEKSFSWTIRAYGAALLFFLAAATFFIIHQTNVSYFTALGTALAGVFAGLIQAHGKQVDKEAKECRVSLDRIQRFIIAYSACEGLNGSEKQQMRSKIIIKLFE